MSLSGMIFVVNVVSRPFVAKSPLDTAVLFRHAVPSIPIHYWPLAWKYRYLRITCAVCYTLGSLLAL